MRRRKTKTRAAIGSPMAKEMATRIRAETDLQYFDTRHAQAFFDLLADELTWRIHTRREVTIPSIGTLSARATREYVISGKRTRRLYTTLRLTGALRARMYDAVVNRDPDTNWQRAAASPPGMTGATAGGNGAARSGAGKDPSE